MPINLLDTFGHLPFNERSAIFILVSLYVHQTSTCGVGLCAAEDRKLNPTFESSIFVLCIAIIASKYDWWPQKLIKPNIMQWLVNLIYKSWIALILTNLTENFILVPLYNFTGMIADALVFGVNYITGKESDGSENSDSIGCMILWLLSLAFLFYILTNDGAIGLFINDLKMYIKESREAREMNAMAFGCISAASSFDDEEEPRRQIKQRRRRRNCPKPVSPRRCQSNLHNVHDD